MKTAALILLAAVLGGGCLMRALDPYHYDREAHLEEVRRIEAEQAEDDGQ